MYKRLLVLMGILLLCLLLFCACGKSKITLMQEEVKMLAEKMNNEFENIKNSVKELDKYYETLYATVDWNSIDISKIDEKSGGRFYLTGYGTQYATRYKNDPQNMSITTYGIKPVDDMVKKELLLIQSSQQKTEEELKKLKYVGIIDFFTMSQIGTAYPGYDLISQIPWPLDFTPMPWFQGLLNAKDEIILFPPVISVGPDGITEICGTNTNVDNKPYGIVDYNLQILKLTADLIKEVSGIACIAYSDTNVYAASKKMKDTLKVKVMIDFDYVEQLKANPKFSDEFKLNAENQSADLKKDRRID